MNVFDEYLTYDEIRLINQLKDKNRMERDEIIGGYQSGKV